MKKMPNIWNCRDKYGYNSISEWRSLTEAIFAYLFILKEFLNEFHREVMWISKEKIRRILSQTEYKFW